MRLVTPAGSHHAIVSFGIALLTSLFCRECSFPTKVDRRFSVWTWEGRFSARQQAERVFA